MTRFVRSISFAVVAFLTVGSSVNADETLVRLGDGRELSQKDLSRYAQLNNYALRDPWLGFQAATSDLERADAIQFLDLSSTYLLWNEAWAAKADAAAYQIADETLRLQPDREYCGCLEDVSIAQAGAQAAKPETIDWDAFVADNPDLLKREESRVCSLIYKRVEPGSPKSAEDAALAELTRVRNLIAENKMTFHQAATLFSDAPSGRKGGEVGAISRTLGINQKLKDFIFQWDSTGVHGPVILHNGAYLLHLRSISKGHERTLAELVGNPSLAAEVRGRVSSWLENREKKRLGSLPPDPLLRATTLEGELADQQAGVTECHRRRDLRRQQIVAWTFFESQQEKLEPTAEEVQAYYEAYPDQMKESGSLRLTRYDVPARGAEGQRIRDLKDAFKLAESTRKLLIDAPADQSPNVEQLGVVVYRTTDWVNGVGQDEADRYLHTMKVPGWTPVFSDTEKAFFVYAVEKRERKMLPLEERREYINGLLRFRELDRRVTESRTALADDLITFRAWILPSSTATE